MIYQLPKYPYSYFSKALEFYLRSAFVLVSILNYFCKTPNSRYLHRDIILYLTGFWIRLCTKKSKKGIFFQFNPSLGDRNTFPSGLVTRNSEYNFSRNFSLKPSVETLIIIVCDFVVCKSINYYFFQKIILYVWSKCNASCCSPQLY